MVTFSGDECDSNTRVRASQSVVILSGVHYESLRSHTSKYPLIVAPMLVPRLRRRPNIEPPMSAGHVIMLSLHKRRISCNDVCVR